MNRKTWIIFAVVQCVGELCFWTWGYIATSAVGLFLWGTSLVTLFPGNILSAVALEKMLWGSRVGLITMQVIEIPFEIAINTAVWWLIAKSLTLLMKRVQAHNGAANQRV
jgi:hypothetical protein